MARVNIEQTAQVDPRFNALGRRIGGDRYAALGRMVPIWDTCQERGTYELTRETVGDLHPDLPGFYDAMIAANLARETTPDVAYICGTRGRIEWLTRKRETARQNGLKSAGRPPKERQPKTNIGTDVGFQENQAGFPQDTALALASALASAPAVAPATCSGSEEKAEGSAAPPLRLVVETEAASESKPVRERPRATAPVDRDGEAYRLAALFLDRLRALDPKAKADLNKWARQLAPMIADRGPAEIEAAIRYAMSSSREARYTRSPEGLARNITGIVIAMRGTPAGVGGKPGGTNEHFRSVFGER